MNAKHEVEEWLSTYSNPNTRANKRGRLNKFLEHAEMTLEDLVKLTAKDARKLILITQAKMVEKRIKNNSIIAYISSVKTFFDEQLDKPITKLKGKIIDKQMAMGFHIFGNGDLSQMFEHGDIRMKALLATSTSLGWEISAIANMDRQLFKDITEKAISENQQFVFFMTQRKKTGKPRLAVLNTLAIEWLHKWFSISKDKKTVFGIGEDMISNLLKQNVKQSKIKTTGKIRFHNLRGWVMGSLSKAGFNTFEIKYIMGKSIPDTDMTYLRTLQDDIETKYPELYEKYLSIQPISAVVSREGKHITDEDYRLLKIFKNVLEIYDSMKATATQASDSLDPQIREYAEVKSPLLDAVLLAKAFRIARSKGED